ncbi:MAG: hypothetical protein WC755_04520 [Candidatus Woesearchaeota archaeon]
MSITLSRPNRISKEVVRRTRAELSDAVLASNLDDEKGLISYSGLPEAVNDISDDNFVFNTREQVLSLKDITNKYGISFQYAQRLAFAFDNINELDRTLRPLGYTGSKLMKLLKGVPVVKDEISIAVEEEYDMLQFMGSHDYLSPALKKTNTLGGENIVKQRYSCNRFDLYGLEQNHHVKLTHVEDECSHSVTLVKEGLLRD